MYWSKRSRLGSITVVVVFVAIFGVSELSCAQVPSGNATETNRCDLTEADKIANAELSVSEFDYVPTLPSTARALNERQCYASAAEAGEDYLVRGTIDSERHHSSVIFHVGQNLALSGDERGGARMIAAAKRPTQAAGASFDWNTYVIGTWAFMQRDRELLQTAFDRLRGQPGEGNQANAKVLGGLLHCYGQPYSMAYSPSCQNLSEDTAAPAR